MNLAMEQTTFVDYLIKDIQPHTAEMDKIVATNIAAQR